MKRLISCILIIVFTAHNVNAGGSGVEYFMRRANLTSEEMNTALAITPARDLIMKMEIILPGWYSAVADDGSKMVKFYITDTIMVETIYDLTGRLKAK